MITAMSLTNGTFTAILDNGESILTAREDHPKWKDIIEAFKSKDEDAIRNLLSMKKVIEVYSNGDLTINGTGVLYKNREMHGVDVDRCLAFLKEGLPYEPYANYMVRKMNNTSARAIEELYKFLEHKNMSLTPEGKFIAYKGVQSNLYSVMGNTSTVVLSGTVDSNGHILNEIGAVIEVERSSVDDNYNNGCSFGLHAGSLNYASTWGARMILVEIDPADVVSVPDCSQFQKLRCCKYKVIGEYRGALPSSYTNEFSTKEVVTKEDPDDTDAEQDKWDEEDDSEICSLCGEYDCDEHCEDECEHCGYSDCEGGDRCDHVDDCPQTGDESVVEVAENAGIFDNENDKYEEFYLQGLKDGIKDVNRISQYINGDEYGADSIQHKHYIMGYLFGQK
jgi:hypothetical protein